MAAAQSVAEVRVPPPLGSPYSVPLSGTEEQDRSPIYRHWRFKERELLETLDPKARYSSSTFGRTTYTS